MHWDIKKAANARKLNAEKSIASASMLV